MRHLTSRAALIMAAVCLVCLGGRTADAQYFGQNRVQHRRFDFKILKTEHFDIYYYAETEQNVRIAGRMAERWYARLSRLLDFNFTDRQPLILYASQPDFQQTNSLGGSQPGEGTGGVTESFKRRVILPYAGPLGETDHVLGHELVHAFQYALSGQMTRGGFRETAAQRLPLWFIEGMAEYLTLGPVDTNTSMWLRDAVLQDKVPQIKKLDNPKYFPYRWGQALWAYIAGRWGDPVVGKILRAGNSTGGADAAIQKVLGKKVDELSKEWHDALKAAYKPTDERKAQARASQGHLLIARKEKKEGGEINVGPVVSPDGERLVFISERGQFSLELFMANARTGQVSERLSKTATDPHFDSLQFINSAGAWDPQGRRFVLAAVSEGEAVLSIIDVEERGKRAKDLRLPGVDEAFTPSWSPDGTRIAFSGLAHGVLDLFVYELSSGQLRRITDDSFAELHPTWSPDGKEIAIATDRFSSSLDELSFGNYRLAVVDPGNGQLRPLPSFEHAKNVNPQWSPDGASLFFVSDRGGTSNVYRLDRKSGQISQVTDLLTGVSGITSLSPALSVASREGRLAYNVFEDGKYDIYTIGPDDERTERPVDASELVAETPSMPPAERSNDEVVALKNDPELGLPDARRFREQRYKSKLTLDYVAPPYMMVGSDRFGSYVGGGTALFFSDMLGDHSLGMTVQANGGFNDIAGAVAYQNLKSRVNWGVAVSQSPYLYSTYGATYVDLGTDIGVMEQNYIFRQVDRSISGALAVPFSRARRFELIGGFRNVSFQQEVETYLSSATTGYLYDYTKTKLDSPYKALNLAEGSGALVYDTSVFSATSPILGRRWRAEVGGTAGSLNYATVLGDLRQYVMPVRPFTIATRLMHYSRLGSGAIDERIYPLFLGYPGLVRGYDSYSFSGSECEFTQANPTACPVYDRLFGTRLLVGNVELRFPLLGLFGGSRYYGPFPIEGAVFYDTGIAWGDRLQANADGTYGAVSNKFKLTGPDRGRVASYGATVRVNVFGFAIVEIDYVKPLDRPQKRSLWQFNFIPGF